MGFTRWFHSWCNSLDAYFYTTTEMSTRLGFFYVANPVTLALSSLLAYAIFFLHGHAGLAGWRWVFMIEGLMTLVVGVMAIFLMPPSVSQTKSWLFPKGWYTDRQEKILVNRVLRDDPSKGDMHNREGLTLKMLWMSLREYDLWRICISRLMTNIISAPINKYQAILYRSQGFSTLKTNLLMIPSNMLAIITLLTTVHLSKWSGQYAPIFSLSSLWWIPCLAAMRWWPGFLHDPWGSYVLIFIGLGAPYDSAIANSWVSANSYSVRSRTVSGALVNISGQLSQIIGANIFRADDAPRYRRGISQLFAISIAAFAVTYLAKVYYIVRNKYKQRKWSKMSMDEQSEYLSTTAMTAGNKRLDFMFVH